MCKILRLIAQWLERAPDKRKVSSSNLLKPKFIFNGGYNLIGRVLNCDFKSYGFKSHYPPIYNYIFMVRKLKFINHKQNKSRFKQKKRRVFRKYKRLFANNKPVFSNAKTPASRHYKFVRKFLLCKQNNLIKSLKFNIRRCVGRSSLTGQITVWGRGGGCKKLYRQLQFFTKQALGVILFSFYDPNRNNFVSAFFDFVDYKFHYIPAVKSIAPGFLTGCLLDAHNLRLGFRAQLKDQPMGALFTSLALNSYKTPQYALAAGTFCQLLQRTTSFCSVRLPSKQIIRVSPLSFGTLGVASNKFNRFMKLGKAGRSRLKGIRPHVKGVSMNPVDHPHGGRTRGGRDWVTPWGKPFRFRSTSRSTKKKIYKL